MSDEWVKYLDADYVPNIGDEVLVYVKERWNIVFVHPFVLLGVMSIFDLDEFVYTFTKNTIDHDFQHDFIDFQMTVLYNE